MRHLLLIPMAGVLVACSGGGASQEDAPAEPIRITSEAAADMSMTDMADQLITDSESLTGLLSGVTDNETAEAIRPDIEAMVENYQVLLTRFESMGEPSFSEMASLASRLPDLANTQQSLATEIERIYKNHPEATAVLRDTLENIGRAPTP
ncbi:MAG: hypothetical protein AAFP97_12525 [Pseudomonadota bacterium]